MKNLYRQTDKYLQLLKKKIRTEFNRLSVLSFDELNVASTRKITIETYEHLLDFNEHEYLKVVEYAHETTMEELTPEEREKVKDIKFPALLALILASYNPITGYLYENEAERKRLRLSEQMMTAREYENTNLYNDSLKRSANLWYTQSAQYGQDIADEVSLRTLKKAGIKYIKWNTEKDSRVCKSCRERDGQIYPIDDHPEKEHYHCRCYYTPYRGEI